MILNLKAFLTSGFIAVLFASFGQKELFFSDLDTIKIDYRSGGHSLDAVDAFLSPQLNLRPGAGFGTVYEQNLPENLFASVSGLFYAGYEKKITPKYTGLPYLGFQYAFGSKLTQDLNLEYQQFYRPNTHLHFLYNRKTSNGFLRNGDYKLNDLNLRFYHAENFYATNFEGTYGAYNMAQNGGISTDSLLSDFAIEFTPVKKENARTEIRKLDLKWDNFFRLVGDSSTVQTGIKTKHQFEIINRTFSESLFDLSVIDTFYIDTNGNTRDQFQTASLRNGAGVYFSSSIFQIDASLNHAYWRNQNLGVNRDTNEVFLHSNLWANFGNRLELRNEFYFNLIGATGELKNYAEANFNILRKLRLSGQINFENIYPVPYQRFHTANYFQWHISDLKMQQKLQLKGSLKFGQTDFIRADIQMTNINNGRYFIDNQWRQDTLDFVSVGSFQLKGAYHVGKWAFYPSATVRFHSANFSYQPVFSTLNRIAFNTALFKARKLGFTFGVDVGFDSEYNHLNYNEILDLYQPIDLTVKTPGLFRLNTLLAISLDDFRFFVKAENISTFFQDKKTRIDENYPLMPFLVRIGVTWDFFN